MCCCPFQVCSVTVPSTLFLPLFLLSSLLKKTSSLSLGINFETESCRFLYAWKTGYQPLPLHPRSMLSQPLKSPCIVPQFRSSEERKSRPVHNLDAWGTHCMNILVQDQHKTWRETSYYEADITQRKRGEEERIRSPVCSIWDLSATRTLHRLSAEEI